MLTPLPLTTTVTKSNLTINQPFTLNITISPTTLLYDSHQIILSKSTLVLQQDWIPAYVLTENSTHYMLDKSGLVQNNVIVVNGKNNLITGLGSRVVVSLLQAGYFVQQATV
jgi:hypothetical protein